MHEVRWHSVILYSNFVQSLFKIGGKTKVVLNIDSSNRKSEFKICSHKNHAIFQFAVYEGMDLNV
jgi:hypothetical protein